MHAKLVSLVGDMVHVEPDMEYLRAKRQHNKEKIGKLLKFRLLTAKEIVRSAIAREESVGVHFINKGQ